MGFTSRLRRFRLPSASRRSTALTERTEDEADALPDNLAKLVGEFQLVTDTMQRYKKLLRLGVAVRKLPEEARSVDNMVTGCASSLWMQSRVEGELMYFDAYSNSLLDMGFAALLMEGLSGRWRIQLTSVPLISPPALPRPPPVSQRRLPIDPTHMH
jgi:cysteine desulfuration protein SufE